MATNVGYTTIGATDRAFDINARIRINVDSSAVWTATAGDTVTGYACYGYFNAGANLRFALYDISAANASPVGRPVVSGSDQLIAASDTPNWYSGTFAAVTLTAGHIYAMAVMSPAANLFQMKYDAGKPANSQYASPAQTTAPATWTTPDFIDPQLLSMYFIVNPVVTADPAENRSARQPNVAAVHSRSAWRERLSGIWVPEPRWVFR